LYEKGINQGAVQWCVAAGATPGWAQRLYPQLSPEAALERLWEQLYSLVRADQEDPLTAWKLHAEKLKRRCEWLNNLNISELHFQGPGTDLRVGLSWQARFTGGTHKSSSGTEFTPNVPTEEVFTTPDWHLTTGVVRATRPVLIYGKPVEGLVCEFQKGRLVNFSANVGADSFAALIDTDEGARQLGEVALVGIDSPVFQSGMVFNEILLDENAACHIAVGSAYRNCLQGSTDMSEENLKEVGCNESKIHVDLMISDEETNVTAVTRQQGPVPLIRSGLFVEA
jgi:aminopeptidase